MRNDICYVGERKIRIGLLNVIFLDNRFLVISFDIAIFFFENNNYTFIIRKKSNNQGRTYYRSIFFGNEVAQVPFLKTVDQFVHAFICRWNAMLTSLARMKRPVEPLKAAEVNG